MGQGQKPARKRHARRYNSRKSRTRARTRDLDQVAEDMAPKTPLGLREKRLREKREAGDLSGVLEALDEGEDARPGFGLFYCTPCAKDFIDNEALEKHRASKVHKRRLKDLQNGIYTQKDADAAVGLGTDNRQERARPSETQVQES